MIQRFIEILTNALPMFGSPLEWLFSALMLLGICFCVPGKIADKAPAYILGFGMAAVGSLGFAVLLLLRGEWFVGIGCGILGLIFVIPAIQGLKEL